MPEGESVLHDEMPWDDILYEREDNRETADLELCEVFDNLNVDNDLWPLPSEKDRVRDTWIGLSPSCCYKSFVSRSWQLWLPREERHSFLCFKVLS